MRNGVIDVIYRKNSHFFKMAPQICGISNQKNGKCNNG